MNTTADQIAELSAALAEKHEQARRLALELCASIRIEDIWPEAFKGGQRCTLCARESIRTMEQARFDAKRGKLPALQEMYLRRDDGARFELDAATYWILAQQPRGKSNDRPRIYRKSTF